MSKSFDELLQEVDGRFDAHEREAYDRLPGMRRVGPIHTLTVHAFEEEEEEVDFEVEHDPETCGNVARYVDDDGEIVYEPNCLVWWQLSEGGSLLEQLELEKIEPGTYKIQGWTQTYPGTPDHATEYDAGLLLIQENS